MPRKERARKSRSKKRAARANKRTKAWKSYEQIAEFLLEQFANAFRLGRVEGKQIVPGKSGAKWEIEAKAVLVQEEGFLIVECRRYTKSRLNQESLGGLAFRIRDTGAAGGIVVSPLGFQRGANSWQNPLVLWT